MAPHLVSARESPLSLSLDPCSRPLDIEQLASEHASQQRIDLRHVTLGAAGAPHRESVVDVAGELDQRVRRIDEATTLERERVGVDPPIE